MHQRRLGTPQNQRAPSFNHSNPPRTTMSHPPPKSQKEALFWFFHLSGLKNIFMSDRHSEGEPQRRPQCLHVTRYWITLKKACPDCLGILSPSHEKRSPEQTNGGAAAKCSYRKSSSHGRGHRNASAVPQQFHTAHFLQNIRLLASEFCVCLQLIIMWTWWDSSVTAQEALIAIFVVCPWYTGKVQAVHTQRKPSSC